VATGELASAVPRHADAAGLRLRRRRFNDPQHFETHLGPGAYSNDLATTSGTIGLFVQAQPRSATSLVWPLLCRGHRRPDHQPRAAARRADSDQRAALHPGPGRPAAAAGAARRLPAGRFRRLSRSADQCYASPPVFFPAAPVLVGLDFWMQAVIVAPGFVPADATNAVR